MPEEISIKRLKRLYYLKAEFSNTNEDLSLEQLLRSIYTNILKLAEQRVVVFNDKQWHGTFYHDLISSFCFQFSASVPGDAATIIPTGNLADPIVQLRTATAPKGFEFSDGDAICLVSKNDIFACFSQINYHKIEPFIQSIFTLSNYIDEKYKITIHKPADINKIALLMKRGVRSITFSESLTNAEFSLLSSRKSLSSRILSALIEKDKPLFNNAKEAGSRFKITLTGGRKPQKWLSDEAKHAIDEEEQYRIELKDGTIITPHTITISRTANFTPYGKSVFVGDAIKELEVFKNDVLKE